MDVNLSGAFPFYSYSKDRIFCKYNKNLLNNEVFSFFY
jgi:hypothetical protein